MRLFAPLFLFAGLAFSSPLTISLPDLFTPINFVSHSDYLAKNILFAPIDNLKGQIEAQYSVTLKDRGEAHITVISPPEFAVLRNYVSIKTINNKAKDILQTTPFTVTCLGRGELVINGINEQTYFVVVNSNGLFDLRREILTLAIEKGFDGAGFDPDEFYPHITIGFTSRDLHLSDGVIKDSTSCIAEIIDG